jgi:hypothetical protein
VKFFPDKIADLEILLIHETCPKIAFLFRGVNLAPTDNKYARGRNIFSSLPRAVHEATKKGKAG